LLSNVWGITEDKKGNIWTTGEVNPQVWALSRYDAKSLYDKMPTVTEIKSGGPSFLGILEANDGSIWFGALGLEIGVYRYDGKTITHFKNAAGQKYPIWRWFPNCCHLPLCFRQRDLCYTRKWRMLKHR